MIYALPAQTGQSVRRGCISVICGGHCTWHKAPFNRTVAGVATNDTLRRTPSPGPHPSCLLGRNGYQPAGGEAQLCRRLLLYPVHFAATARPLHAGIGRRGNCYTPVTNNQRTRSYCLSWKHHFCNRCFQESAQWSMSQRARFSCSHSPRR